MIQYNPSITTSGLVLYFDVANKKSYPGSGTVIKDMSSLAASGTIVNAPTYSSANMGSLVLTGTQGITVANPLLAVGQTNQYQEWTVSAWVSVTGTTNQYLVNLDQGMYLVYVGGSSIMYLNSSTNDYYMYGGSLTNLGWVYATYRFSNGANYRTIYRNGVNISTRGPNQTSTPAGLGATLTLFSGVVGNVATCEMYSRVLTDAEVLRNYNATKSRYGL